jgi:predicted nucleic acid-binding protein
MSQLFCYTTVFNAIELFSLCESASERQVVEDIMHSVKILGLNGKSAKNVGMYLGQSRTRHLRDMEILIAGLCLESRLPILTGRPRRYRALRSLRVVTTGEVVGSHKKGILWS